MQDSATFPDRPTAFPARVWRRVRILGGTALVAALAAAGVIASTGYIAANSVRVQVEDAAAPLTVAVIPFVAQDSYRVTQQFIGLLEPARQERLGFEAGGTVTEVLVDEGDNVTEGQVLARLDTRALAAERDQASAARDALTAQRDLARLTADRQVQLAQRNVASAQRADETRFQVAELDARLAEIDARLTGLDIQLDKAVLRAPFPGEIGARLLDDGARVGPASPVLDLLETGAPRVRVGLAPDVAAGLAADASFEVMLAGEPARLTLISRRSGIDPVTRTRPTLFAVERALAGPLAFGDVIQIDLPRQVSGSGGWVPLSALIEGPRGLWSVYVIDDTGNEPLVARESVELVHATEAQAYVRGALADGTWIVGEGTHRLGVGQPVLLTPAES